MSIQFLEGAAAGLAAGVFLPGVLRKAKALFVEYGGKLVAWLKSKAVAAEKKL